MAGGVLYFRSARRRATLFPKHRSESRTRALTAGTVMGVLLFASLVTSVLGF